MIPKECAEVHWGATPNSSGTLGHFNLLGKPSDTPFPSGTVWIASLLYICFNTIISLGSWVFSSCWDKIETPCFNVKQEMRRAWFQALKRWSVPHTCIPPTSNHHLWSFKKEEHQFFLEMICITFSESYKLLRNKYLLSFVDKTA